MYRELLGDFEPSPMFGARVWAAIEARRESAPSWWSYLIAWSPRLAAASLALAALALFSQWAMLGPENDSLARGSSYEDLLIEDIMKQSNGAIWVLAENGE